MTLKDLKKIRVRFLTDDMDCETCGGNWAEGAEVFFEFDSELDFILEPVAHCYNGTSYDTWDVFKTILSKLGYEVVEEGR